MFDFVDVSIKHQSKKSFEMSRVIYAHRRPTLIVRVCVQAIQGLNGMQLGDKKLVVQLASIGAKTMPTSMASNPLVNAPVQVQVPGLNLTSVSSLTPTEVLCLLNMVTEDELVDDDEYEDIVEDVKEECNKYGKVRSIEIPRPKSGIEVPGVGKVRKR